MFAMTQKYPRSAHTNVVTINPRPDRARWLHGSLLAGSSCGVHHQPRIGARTGAIEDSLDVDVPDTFYFGTPRELLRFCQTPLTAAAHQALGCGTVS